MLRTEKLPLEKHLAIKGANREQRLSGRGSSQHVTGNKVLRASKGKCQTLLPPFGQAAQRRSIRAKDRSHSTLPNKLEQKLL
jgi:hypothetical protein